MQAGDCAHICNAVSISEYHSCSLQNLICILTLWHIAAAAAFCVHIEESGYVHLLILHDQPIFLLVHPWVRHYCMASILHLAAWLTCTRAEAQPRLSGLILQWQLWKADTSSQMATLHTALLCLLRSPVSTLHCTAALQDLLTTSIWHPRSWQTSTVRLHNKHSHPAMTSLAASSRKQVALGSCPPSIRH